MSVLQVIQGPPQRPEPGTGQGFGRKIAVKMRPWIRDGLLMSLTVAYLFPIVWILYRIGDDGTLIYDAQRVSEGALPGRDFLEVMGPGSFYWLGLFFKLFGLGWQVTRLVVLFTGVATVGLLYAMARQVCRESVAVLVLLFVVVVGLPLWPTVSHHWDSNFFAVTTVWCYLRLEKTGGWAWAVAAGTLAGVTSCVMPQKGVLLLASLIASGTLRRVYFGPSLMTGSALSPAGKPPKWTAIWLLAGSFAAVGIGVLAAYWKAGALADLYKANVIWPLSGYHAVNEIPYGLFLLSTAMGTAFRAIGPDWPITGLFCTGLSLIPLMVVAALPLLASALTLACLFAADKRRGWLGSPLLTLLLAGGALWLSEMQRRDFAHLVYGSPVLLIVLFASAELKFSGPVRKAMVSTVATGLIIFGALNFISCRQGSHAVETRRGTIETVSDDEALRFLCTEVERREFVFVYPYYPAYYYLADVRNPTRFSILLYDYNTPEHFDEVIRNLEQKRVRYVLWDQEVYGDKLRTWFPAYHHPADDKLKLEHYIRANYDQIAVKSGFRILERRDADRKDP